MERVSDLGPIAVVGAISGLLLERLAARLCAGAPPLGPRALICGLGMGLSTPVLMASSASADDFVVAATLLAVLLTAALTDLQERRIPNCLTGGGLALVIAFTALLEPQAVAQRLIFALLVFTFFLLAAVLRPGGLGLGDVKLVAVMGAALGAASLTAIGLALVGAALFGAAIASRRGWSRARSATVPLAPFLAGGSLVILLLSG